MYLDAVHAGRWGNLLRTVAALATCAGAGALCACAAKPEAKPREWTPSSTAEARAEFLAMRNAPDDLMAPAVRGGTDGLEVVWWIALDESDKPGESAIARALAPYADQPLPLGADRLKRLEANGVRMVRIPLADAGAIESSLRLIGARNRQWVGWALEWREVFSGRPLPPGALLVIDGERERIGAGMLRLIARCWTTPSASGSGAALRLELASQAKGARDGADDRAAALRLELLRPGAEVEAIDAMRDGRALPAVSFDADLEPGWAYAITAEAPGVAWRGATAKNPTNRERTAAPAPLNPDGLVPLSSEANPDDGSASLVGPEAASPPTIGEAMLMNLNRLPHEPAARVVILLIPRTPASSALPAATTR